VFRGLFVTGTDTGVGKTVVSAALMHRFRASVQLKYWKPVQTGIEQDDDTATVKALGRCADDEVVDGGARLPGPFSPHLSARLSGRTIRMDDLLEVTDRQRSTERWIVEGAGGVLVPLNDRELTADFMVRLGLPVTVVARTSLGTINHTLLTIEALRSRAIEVVGAILVGQPNEENRAAIERYGCLPVLGELPILTPLNPESLALVARTLDGRGRMLEYLR
jgi:malonyl-CoA O-methyltransferase